MQGQPLSMNFRSPPGFGLRQSSGAFTSPGVPKAAEDCRSPKRSARHGHLSGSWSQWAISNRTLVVNCVGAVILLLFGSSALAGRNPRPALNTATPYLIYYGDWTADQVEFARTHYRLVIFHPLSNLTAAQIATIQRGLDNLPGTADDVLVLGYLSIGEDDRPGAPFTGDLQGPRIDPRPADTAPLSSITNALGSPSPGGSGYASYYLDTKSSPDGLPDRNAAFGGYFVNAGAPAWWTVIRNMTRSGNGQAGLAELLTAQVGNGYNCDGVFLDTLDTAAPNSFGATSYEWTAPGMQGLVQRISTNYPGKLILGNRGLFFYNPNLKTYAYTLRPWVNLVMFESYFTDSNNSNNISPSFPDNKYNYAPKLNAEAGRPDGFVMLALDYDHTPPLPPATIAQSYAESMGEQGWLLYRTNPWLDAAFNTGASSWLATNADTQPPVWDSTAAQSGLPPAPRVGVQQVVPGNRSVTVRWDVARDQTGPVRYNLYYTTQSVMDFVSAVKLAHVRPSMPANYAAGSGPGTYPYEYTITGLTNGVACLFAIRAEDSATPAHEDTNQVALAATPYVLAAAGPYEIWEARFFSPAELANPDISGDGADPDHDGIPNLVEYAFNLNPRVAEHPPLPRAWLAAQTGHSYLYLQYLQRNPPADVQYVPQVSVDLRAWSSDPANFSPISSSDNGDGTSLITLRLEGPVDGHVEPRFARIAIQR